MNNETLSDFEFRATELLFDEGITVRWGVDFNVFKLILIQQRERHAVAPGFDPSHEKGANLDGIWLTAHDANGVLIHTQAARHSIIKPTLQHHLQTQGEAYEPDYWTFDSARSRVALTPSAAAVSGSAVYHGENWILGGPSGYRGGHYLYLFCRMMLGRILRTWSAETIYGFVTPQTAPRGLAQRVGYIRCEPCSIEFDQDEADPVELWLVWMKRVEAEFVMRLSPDYYVSRFGNRKPQVSGLEHRKSA